VKVYLVAHSHLDPGWLETVPKYYRTKVRDILDNVLGMLRNDTSLKFTWAEAIYLKLYMDDRTVDAENK
jgi:hypothetical protein